MAFLNYHHLRYFHAIARDGTLTGAARRLNVSQSALSAQLRSLEQALGCPLFDREHKGLVLTEEGRMALDYAETIFQAGDELMSTLVHRKGLYQQALRVGAAATLSRNFQLEFLRPALNNTELEVIIRTGSFSQLLAELESHRLDLVLANQPLRGDNLTPLESRLIDQQPVSLVGRRTRHKRKALRFPEDLQGKPLILPTTDAAIRVAFDAILHQHAVYPLIAAEADDMAILRLMARSCDAWTLVPLVVVQDELRSGELVEIHRVEPLRESFYAITSVRRYPNPALRQLLADDAKRPRVAALPPPRPARRVKTADGAAYPNG
jgi:LysR family transcriptional regulator, transcriptional activator of nhaA